MTLRLLGMLLLLVAACGELHAQAESESQPDTSKQVFLPITDVDVSWGTVSVRGEYDTLADAGTSYRIYAPPGVETRGAAAGLLEERWVAGRSSRCLYAGYRYEAPLAGLPTWTGASPSAVARQTGKNFAGLHYTLHRHYDPALMRFTSPDPIASPFYNLNHYAGNNPSAFYDPDGLSAASLLYASLVPALHEAGKRVWDFVNHPDRKKGSDDGLSDGLKNGWKQFLPSGETSTVVWDHAKMRREFGGYADRAQQVHDEHGGAAATAWFLYGTVGHQEIVEAAYGMDPDPYQYGYKRGHIAGEAQWQVAAALMGGRFGRPGRAYKRLPSKKAATFTNGRYQMKVTGRTTTLYRVHGGNSKRIGGYWTREFPTSQSQVRSSLALSPEWNSATHVTTIRVPPGVVIYEGTAARQGRLVGGGNQVVVPKVDPNWVQSTKPIGD